MILGFKSSRKSNLVLSFFDLAFSSFAKVLEESLASGEWNNLIFSFFDLAFSSCADFFMLGEENLASGEWNISKLNFDFVFVSSLRPGCFSEKGVLGILFSENGVRIALLWNGAEKLKYIMLCWRKIYLLIFFLFTYI